MPKYMIALRMPRHADKDPATILLCRSRCEHQGKAGVKWRETSVKLTKEQLSRLRGRMGRLGAGNCELSRRTAAGAGDELLGPHSQLQACGIESGDVDLWGAGTCWELHTLHMAYLSLLPNRFVRPVDGDVSIAVRRCDARGDDGGLRYKARDRGR